MKRKLLQLSALFTLSTTAFGQMPTNGLLFYYTCEGNLVDQSGNILNGSFQNGTYLEDGMKTGDGCINYTDIDKKTYVVFEKNPDPFKTPDFSFVCFVKMEATKNAYSNFIEIGEPAGKTVYFRMLRSGLNAQQLQVGHFDAIANKGQSLEFANDNINGTWKMLGMSSKLLPGGTQRQYNLYINGVEVASSTGSKAPTIEYDPNTLSLSLFHREGVNDFGFKGLADDIAYYNVTLTPTEMMNYYNAMVNKSVGVKKNLNPIFSLVPNPATQTVQLNGVQNGAEITFIDNNGKVILQQTTTELNPTVDLSNIANGVYQVKVKSNGNQMMNKLVVTH